MGNCFTNESSGRIRSESESESRPPPSPRVVDTTPVNRQPLPLPLPPPQTTRTPNCGTDKNKAKKKVRFADEAVCSELKKKEEVKMRVKIVMRKKDAALLLAMLSAGDNQSAIDGVLSN